jgi:uncharacterized protein DUF3551
VKSFLAAALLTAASLVSISAAQAQNGPWCAHYDFGSDETVNCGFYSFQQCLSDVRGVGGFCSQNSTYGLSPRRSLASLLAQVLTARRSLEICNRSRVRRSAFSTPNRSSRASGALQTYDAGSAPHPTAGADRLHSAWLPADSFHLYAGRGPNTWWNADGL